MFSNVYQDAISNEKPEIREIVARWEKNPLLMEKAAMRIWEVAKNGMVYRSYVFRCHLAERIMKVVEGALGTVRDFEPAPETVSAHTNLVMAIMDGFLKCHYGFYVDETIDGYCYMDIMEAIRRHDLPENVIGDIPDNGSLKHEIKAAEELKYFQWYSSLSPDMSPDMDEYENIFFEKKVWELLEKMENKTSSTGKALYLADKIAAVIMTLCYDSRGRNPYLSEMDDITKRDIAEMKIASRDNGIDSKRFNVSELWAIDYFKVRKMWKYDDTGFFTALLIAIFVKFRGEWFSWRE